MRQKVARELRHFAIILKLKNKKVKQTWNEIPRPARYGIMNQWKDIVRQAEIKSSRGE